MEWLMVWGAGNAAWSAFRPILEDLAKDVSKDAAKSYVGKCFKSVFGAVHRKPLIKATGLALKELLELFEGELIRTGVPEHELRLWLDDVARFASQDGVREAIASLFLDPEYLIDPRVFAKAWLDLSEVHRLPADFPWDFMAKRFARKVKDIRYSIPELRDAFAALAALEAAGLIRESAGLAPDFDLESYREALIERFGRVNLEMLDSSGVYYNEMRLWNIFVPQAVRGCDEFYPQLLEIPKEYRSLLLSRNEPAANAREGIEKIREDRRRSYFNQPAQPVLEVLAADSVKHVVILGDPGSGKSSLLQFLALEWAKTEDATLRYSRPIPLLIDLRDYHHWDCPSGKSFAGYLHSAQTWHRLNQHFLDPRRSDTVRIVLMLDGLDEVFDPDQRRYIINDIHRFKTDYRESRIIVTSRSVGYDPKHLIGAGFRHFMLQDLDPDRIHAFLDRWHAMAFEDQIDAALKRARISRAIQSSKSVAMLAENPMLLTLMAILNRHQDLPHERVDLYALASGLLLRHWDMERALNDYPNLHGEVDLRAKIAMLRKIARHMLGDTPGSSDATGNFIDGATLTGLIEEHLRCHLNFQHSGAAAMSVVRQLRERNFIICHLGADTYAFVHRAFLEYFGAADLVHRFNEEHSLSEPDLVTLFEANAGNDAWHEILRLICAQIDTRFVCRVAESLANRAGAQGWDGISPVPEMPLAIWCLGEAREKSRLGDTPARIWEKAVQIQFATKREHRKSQDLGWMFAIVRAVEQSRIPISIPESWRTMADSITVKPFEYPIDSIWPKFLKAVGGKREDIVKLIRTSGNPETRRSAIEVLMEHWIDDDARSLCTELAREDSYAEARLAALKAIAKHWPDRACRELLIERAHVEEYWHTRSNILTIIAYQWKDEAARSLLSERAENDKDGLTRSDCLIMLATIWPDEASRAQLITATIKEKDSWIKRKSAWMLSKKWPDEATYAFLQERAMSDENGYYRGNIIQDLARMWPDTRTRKWVEIRSIEDTLGDARGSALFALVNQWPDAQTRKWITKRTRLDSDGEARSMALRCLENNWHDDETRSVILELAQRELNAAVRGTAFEILAEKWPDDEDAHQTLWRAFLDPDPTVRSTAFGRVAKAHSYFGGLAASKNLDAKPPYLDPEEPISNTHILDAAVKSDTKEGELERNIQSLSAFLGWNIRIGTNAKETRSEKGN
jgi:hypothetical protein